MRRIVRVDTRNWSALSLMVSNKVSINLPVVVMERGREIFPALHGYRTASRVPCLSTAPGTSSPSFKASLIAALSIFTVTTSVL